MTTQTIAKPAYNGGDLRPITFFIVYFWAVWIHFSGRDKLGVG
jgi:hypothetical protein